MNKMQKKALYDNIMRSVSKAIKNVWMKITTMKIIHIISMCVLIKLVIKVWKLKLLKIEDILKIVELLNDGDISYDEVNSVFTKIDKMISGN